MAINSNKSKPAYSVKTCYNCGTPLAINADTCYSCRSKVGEVGKHGKAKKPVDWKSYIICVLAWTIFILYVRWAFFIPK
ncbi:MAG: hypothetical protein R6U50_02400 [Desulfobacterales bacterium]